MPQKRKAAYKPGERISINVTPWLVEGILREGVNNLLVALPKTGKSALSGAIVGALGKGFDSFLGRKIDGDCPEVHLVWPDMPPEDAVYILEREGLWEGLGVVRDDKGRVKEIIGEPKAPIVELVTADLDVREWDFRPANLARYRQEALEAKKRGVKALWCFDCYEVMCGFVGGFDENKSEAGRPAREMCIAFAGTGATTLTIHHSNKAGGGTAVLSASGHASITRPFSTLTQMVWLRPAPQGTTQTDMRVVISQIGRRGSGQLCAELTDTGWVSHGEGEEMSNNTRLEDEWLKLGDDMQGRTFDHLLRRTRLNFGVPVGELTAQLDKEKEKVQRYLGGLLKKGLAWVEKGAHKTPGPGAHGDLWWAAFDPDTGQAFARAHARGEPYSGGQIEKGGQISSNSSSRELIPVEGGLNELNPLDSTPQNDSTPLSSPTRDWGAERESLLGASVYVYSPTKNDWFNGWVCKNASDPDNLRCYKPDPKGGDPWVKSGRLYDPTTGIGEISKDKPDPWPWVPPTVPTTQPEPTYDPEELF